MLWNIWRVSALATVLLALAPTMPSPAVAATLTVTDLGDTGAPGQLRFLITFAGSGDTIVVPAGTIVLSLGALFVPVNVLTIEGAGTSATIIDGGGIDRVFDVIGSGVFGSADATISGVTIRNGNPGAFGDGGGIRNEGILRLIDVAITGNTARSGGGISHSGNLVNTLTLINVTVSGNRASSGGGGISSTGTATLMNVTVSGNTAGAGGGGIVNVGVRGRMNLINVTVTGNSSSGSGGGGVVDFRAGTFLRNVIVSGNTASVGDGNCAGGINSLGHNLESGDSCLLFQGCCDHSGDLSNSDPKLGPLMNNGGPTQTHALLPGSPAIDAGNNNGCPPTDQRGITRPQGSACDIGAYEVATSVTVPGIPTLSAWGLLGLAALLAGMMAVAMRRRRASRL